MLLPFWIRKKYRSKILSQGGIKKTGFARTSWANNENSRLWIELEEVFDSQTYRGAFYGALWSPIPKKTRGESLLETCGGVVDQSLWDTGT